MAVLEQNQQVHHSTCLACTSSPPVLPFSDHLVICVLFGEGQFFGRDATLDPQIPDLASLTSRQLCLQLSIFRFVRCLLALHPQSPVPEIPWIHDMPQMLPNDVHVSLMLMLGCVCPNPSSEHRAPNHTGPPLRLSHEVAFACKNYQKACRVCSTNAQTAVFSKCPCGLDLFTTLCTLVHAHPAVL